MEAQEDYFEVIISNHVIEHMGNGMRHLQLPKLYYRYQDCTKTTDAGRDIECIVDFIVDFIG